MADLAFELHLELAEAKGRGSTHFTCGFATGFGLLANGYFELDIPFLDDDVGVSDRRHERDAHGFGDGSLGCPLFIGNGFVVVEFDGDRFAILDTDAHEEVSVRLAGGDLGLDHCLQRSGDHPIQG
ncbi:hypothetical protein D3C76_1164660 [compost metagenome]